MKITATLKLSGSLLAIVAASISPALAQNSWTGGSSYWTYNGGRVAHYGNHNWHNSSNWGGGTPTAGQDVNIGVATMQQWNYRYWCGGATWDNTCSWSGTQYRPSSYDWVEITSGTAQAGSLSIGFSGGRSHEGSFGRGELRNSSTLAVDRNMVVGSTGAGYYTTSGTTTIGSNYVIGDSGHGEVVNSGTIQVSGTTVLGQHSGSTAMVDNSGSINTGNLVIGAGGAGVFINTGALQVSGHTVIGQHAGSDGTLLNNAGGTFSPTGNLVVGGGGKGAFLTDENVTVGGNTVIGQSAGGSGGIQIGPATASPVEFKTIGDMAVGENGDGILTIHSGNTAETMGRVAIGVGDTSTGTVYVNGTMRNHNTLMVGQYGTGEMMVGSAGSVDTTGDVALGSAANSKGTLINNGSVSNDGRLVVGDHGYGLVRTSGTNAVTNTTGDVTIGADETGIGFVVASQGGTMNNEGRLDLAYEGEGYLVVDRGGEVNNAIGVMGTERDSKAYALVTGTDSLWDNRTSLTIAAEAGADAVLTINDGGTVRVNGGHGIVTIGEEAGSTGILNIGAMSPEGNNYGVDSEVAGYLGSLGLSATNPSARAPGTLDATYVQFGQGEGTVNFRHTGTEATDYRFKAGFLDKGTVNHFEGFTVLDGDSSGFTGAAHVQGGVLVVNNVLAGDVDVSPGAVLRIGHMNGTTGHVVNDMVNNGLVQFNRSNSYVYDKVISGWGDVEQMGTGTTILTGENTYTGLTTINNGTLQLGDGGTTGSIDHTSGVLINANGTLAFNRSDLKVFDRQISGTGEIAQIGTGITRLTQDNSAFTGHTRVDAGTLSIDTNSVLGGTVDVNDGGTLAGRGTVGSTTVHAGGTISPGDYIGTLTVDGNLAQQAGSFYQADVLSTGESDLINVLDTAVISSDAILNVTKLDPARYELEHRYTVLTTANGLTGDYILTGDTFVSTFYRVEDNYDSHNAYLDVTQHRLFQEAGWSVNQVNAATAAQELKWQRDPVTNYPTNPLFRAIAYLPDDETARYAFDHISGEIHASAQGGLLENSRYVRDAVNDRLRAAFGSPGKTEQVLIYQPGIDIKDPTPRPVWVDARHPDRLVLWGDAFGSWGEIEGDGNAALFDRSVGGVMIGADLPWRDLLRIGLVGGYNYSRFDVDDRHSTASVDSYHLGIYGGAEWKRLRLRLGANYSWNSLETVRNAVFPGFAETLTAEYDAHTLQAQGDIGYTFHLGGLNLEPFAGLAYVNLEQDGYSERGGYAALKGPGRATDDTFATLGIRAERSFNLGDLELKANGMVAWRHSFDEVIASNSHAFAGSSSFTVHGVMQNKDMGIVEAGIDAALNENLMLGFAYTGEWGKEADIQGVRGNLNWKF